MGTIWATVTKNLPEPPKPLSLSYSEPLMSHQHHWDGFSKQQNVFFSKKFVMPCLSFKQQRVTGQMEEDVRPSLACIASTVRLWWTAATLCSCSRFSLNVYSYSKYTRDSFKSSLLKVFCNNSLLCIAKSIPQLSILSHLPASSHTVKAQCFKIRLGPLFWNETTLKWHKKEGLIRPTRCLIKGKL